MRWDLFCRVIDNHGDLGVCWRLACDLAERGDTVRLVVDDAGALAWMAPQGCAGVQVLPWSDAGPEPMADVVVEAFGCELPAAYVQALVSTRPVWINLEYLSAESYVERSHRLPSPQAGGLTKWFFFPGFTPATGGLLRERGLMSQMASFDGRAWLAARGWAPLAGERVISVFCYEHARLGDWLDALARQPTLLLATPGPATQQLRALPRPPGLRVQELPWLTQPDYDRLLWSSDLNAVRGEDSFVRAQWAGVPMLWHIYPQHDGVHADKLDAWLHRCLHGAAPALAASLQQAQRAWNALGKALPVLPELPAWRRQALAWRESLLAQDDLATQLRRFAAERGAASQG